MLRAIWRRDIPTLSLQHDAKWTGLRWQERLYPTRWRFLPEGRYRRAGEGVAWSTPHRRPAMMALTSIVGSLLVLVSTTSGNTDGSDCAQIRATFKSAVAAVADADSTYRACVAASLGRDDCKAEYGDLDLAAARFEAMVGDYAKACR